MLESLLSLLTLAIIALAAYGLGRPLAHALGADQEDRLARGVWSVALGLVAAAVGLVGLGLAGLLLPACVVVFSLATALWGAMILLRGSAVASWLQTCGDWPWDEGLGQPPSPAGRAPPAGIVAGAAALALLACLGALGGALAPPIGPDASGLEQAKTTLSELGMGIGHRGRDGRLPSFRPDDTWYLWALVLDGPVAAQLVNWGLGVLLVLATVVLATPVVGRRWAWLAGAVAALVPGLHGQMATSSRGIALGLLSTLALAAWWRGGIEGQSRGWLVTAGLMSGFATAVSPLAAILLVAMAASAGWTRLAQPRPRPPLIRHALAVLMLAAITGGSWYVISPQEELSLPGSPGGVEAASLTAAQYPLGAILPALLPGVLVARRLRGLGTLLAAAVLYGTCWYALGADGRLILPLVGPLAVATAWVAMEIRRFPAAPRRIAIAAAAALATVAAPTAVLRCRPQLPVALGLESRRDYLDRHEPTWPAADLANQVCPPDASLLSEEPNTLYFNCRVTREDRYRRQSRYDARLSRPADLAGVLRQSGFTHLLLAENLNGRGAGGEPTLSRMADAQWAAGDHRTLVKLLDYSVTAPDGTFRRYRLVALPPGREVLPPPLDSASSHMTLFRIQEHCHAQQIRGPSGHRSVRPLVLLGPFGLGPARQERHGDRGTGRESRSVPRRDLHRTCGGRVPAAPGGQSLGQGIRGPQDACREDRRAEGEVRGVPAVGEGRHQAGGQRSGAAEVPLQVRAVPRRLVLHLLPLSAARHRGAGGGRRQLAGSDCPLRHRSGITGSLAAPHFG